MPSQLAGVGNPSAPLGTPQNPVHILQEGKTYRTLQKLTNVQVTKVASGLKDTRPDFNTKENRKIVYINPETNSKIDYKVQ